MARIAPEQYKPILSYHFKVQFDSLNAGPFVTYAKGTTLPSMTNSMLVADHGNTYINIKGKTRWNPITMTLYSMTTPNTSQLLWNYLDTHHKVKDGIDAFRDTYAKDVIITLLNPDDSTVGTWTLIKAILSDLNWGTMDWSGNEIVTAEATFVYDYATYS